MRLAQPSEPRTITVWPTLDGRHRRMLHLFAALWIFSAADLLLTLWAHRFTPFLEMNPVARGFLETGAIGLLVFYKAAMTFVGSGILWLMRRNGRAEMALWGVVFVHVLLAARWSDYTDCCLQSPSEMPRQVEVAMR